MGFPSLSFVPLSGNLNNNNNNNNNVYFPSNTIQHYSQKMKNRDDTICNHITRTNQKKKRITMQKFVAKKNILKLVSKKVLDGRAEK